MDTTDAKKLAESMMEEHGLTEQGWWFRFDNAQSRLGACHHSSKSISISRHYAGAADEESIRQTMLHEIAHALVGVTRDSSGRRDIHGEQWKRTAASIGYVGGRCGENPYAAKRRAAAVTAAGEATLTHAPRIGDICKIVSGQKYLVGQLCRVIGYGTSRYKIQTADGRIFRAPASLIRAIDPSSDAAKNFTTSNDAPTDTPRHGAPSRPTAKAGDRIMYRRSSSSPRATEAATVEKVGRSRYLVVSGGERVYVPFALVD